MNENLNNENDITECILFSSDILSFKCSQFLFAEYVCSIILFFSLTLKIPQILKIYSTKSTKGISSFSLYSDFISGLFQALYCYKKGFSVLLLADPIQSTLQNFHIVILAWIYSEKKLNRLDFLQIFLFCFVTFIFSYVCIMNEQLIPEMIWIIMATSDIPFTATSKFLQIFITNKNKEIGSLSLSTSVMSITKNILKSICVFIKTQNIILIFNQLFKAVLNMIILIQILLYSKNSRVKVVKTD